MLSEQAPSNNRFREELPVRALDGEWQMLDHTALTELLWLAKATDLAILG